MQWFFFGGDRMNSFFIVQYVWFYDLEHRCIDKWRAILKTAYLFKSNEFY